MASCVIKCSKTVNKVYNVTKLSRISLFIAGKVGNEGPESEEARFHG
jgi:hypothetical protein